MTIYCTYITFYSGNLLPPFYIGFVRTSRINQHNYNGSVSSKQYKSTWNLERKQNPHLFKTKILSYHPNKEEAKDKETYLQEFFKVDKNPMYINMSIRNSKFNVPKRTKEHTHKIISSRMSKNYKHSDETKMRISQSKKGKSIIKTKPVSEETKLKISNTNKGRKLSDQTKLKMSERMKLFKHSEETKNKMRKPKKSGYKWFNNGIVEIKLIPTETDVPTNFILGRLK